MGWLGVIAFFSFDIAAVIAASGFLVCVSSKGRGPVLGRLVIFLLWLTFLAWLDWEILGHIYLFVGQHLTWLEGVPGALVWTIVYFSPIIAVVAGALVAHHVVNRAS